MFSPDWGFDVLSAKLVFGHAPALPQTVSLSFDTDSKEQGKGGQRPQGVFLWIIGAKFGFFGICPGSFGILTYSGLLFHSPG
jgi:hypothetical protein